jgi:hypothetical protein
VQRFFRTSDAAAYEQVRLGCDAAWGLPNTRGTTTCFDPAADAPRDAQGRILLAVNSDFCGWEPVATLLPQLLGGGVVQEITHADYTAALPQTPEP